MNDDRQPERAHFSGESGDEFFDNLARALARHLKFENHGTLSDDERTAFLWGFRHGVHHLLGLLRGAVAESPQAFDVIMRVTDEACTEWNLTTHSELRTASVLPTTDAKH
jgi:hypothetical protein